MHAGLPLLVSNRIGNYPEALREGLNGWGFDPTNASGVQSAVHAALHAPDEQLLQMGRESHSIAASVWGSVRAVDAFLDGVLL